MKTNRFQQNHLGVFSIISIVVGVVILAAMIVKVQEKQQLVSQAGYSDSFWSGYWLNSGNGFTLSEHPSWKNVKPFQGVYPWTNNGPTSAWENSNDVVAICNGSHCWQFDVKNGRWVNDGNGFSLSEHPAWKNLKPLQGVYPWSNHGPTAAWENGSVMSVCNKQTCWQFNTTTKQWLRDGNAMLLSEHPTWKNIIPENGVYPWSNNGPTVAWNTLRGRVAVCNGDLCWQYDTNIQRWFNDGIPVHLSTHPAWSSVKPFDGVLPWSNNGPTASWGASNGRTTVCNRGICWTYQLQLLNK